MALLPTNKPGEFAIPELGRVIRLTEWEEMDIYDTVAVAAAVQLTNATLNFYTNVQGKVPVDTNLRTNSKMPARHELIVLKPSVFVLPKWGTATPELADQMAVYQEGSYVLQKNNKDQISETHMWGLASGYGFVAYGVDFAAPGVTVAPGSLGVASPAAIPPLLVPFTIQADDDFDASIDFDNSSAGVAVGAVAAPAFVSHTLSANIAIMAILHGFVKSPGTR